MSHLAHWLLEAIISIPCRAALRSPLLCFTSILYVCFAFLISSHTCVETAFNQGDYQNSWSVSSSQLYFYLNVTFVFKDYFWKSLLLYLYMQFLKVITGKREEQMGVNKKKWQQIGFEQGLLLTTWGLTARQTEQQVHLHEGIEWLAPCDHMYYWPCDLFNKYLQSNLITSKVIESFQTKRITSKATRYFWLLLY